MMGRRDGAEFAEFVAASQASLRRTAFLLCGDWELASDFVQEAYLKVYRKWPKLKLDGRQIGYARAAVTTTVIDALRKKSSKEVVTGELEAHARLGADHTRAHADRDLLMRCLEQLPPRQRACVVLRHYDDLSVTETAGALGCSEGTVKSQTARGLASLQEIYLSETDDELVLSGKEQS